MKPLRSGRAEIKVASELSLQSQKSRSVLGSHLGLFGQRLLGQRSTTPAAACVAKGTNVALLEADVKRAHQLVDELHHFRRDASVHHCVCVTCLLQYQIIDNTSIILYIRKVLFYPTLLCTCCEQVDIII